MDNYIVRIYRQDAEGKGDHRHYKNKEYPYHFKDVDTLIEDFYS